MIRAPGLGEKEPPVERGDMVRVKLDDDTWLLLEVSGVQRDTLSIRVSSGYLENQLHFITVTKGQDY